MKKKYLAVVLTVLFSLNLATLAAAETPFSIITGKDGLTYDYSNDDDHTPVPREILEMPISDEWMDTLTLVTYDPESREMIELSYPVNPYLLPINGMQISLMPIFSTVNPVLIEDTLFLTLRPLMDALKWDVQWNEVDKSIVCTAREAQWKNKITIKLGDKNALIEAEDDYKSICELTTPPCLIDGSTMISTDFVYSCLFHSLLYRYEDQCVYMNPIHPIDSVEHWDN